MHRWRVRYKNDPGPTGNLKRGHPKPETCEVEGCTRPPVKRTYCGMHYQRLHKTGKLGPAEPVKTAEPVRTPCSVDGCDRPRKGRLYCHLHSERLRRTGEVGPVQPTRTRGVVNPGKRGGYVRRTMPDGRRVLEHVLVMEQHFGRRLVDGENVHHKNGIRHDNDLGNLELWLVVQPTGQRVEDLMKYIAEYHAEAMLAMLAAKEGLWPQGTRRTPSSSR